MTSLPGQFLVRWLTGQAMGGVHPNQKIRSPRAVHEVAMNHVFRLLAATVLALTGLVIAASPARAHTGFESSDPADGTTVEEPVDSITLVFSGQAEPTGTGFQLLAPNGELREPTEATTTDGTTWVLRFNPAPSGGVVGVRWMVKAPDAHPIDGSFSFTVTTPAAVPAPESGSSVDDAAPNAPALEPEAAALGATNKADLEAFLDTSSAPTATPRRIGAVARFVTLTGTLIGVGALIFAATVMRGERRDVRHVLHWVRRSGLLVVIGAGLELVAQVALESGGEWSAIWSPSVVGSVVASSFGVAVGLRILGGAGLASGARLDIGGAVDVTDPVLAVKALVGVGAGSATGAVAVDGGDERHARRPVVNEPYVHPDDHAWQPTVGSAGAALGAIAVIAAHLFDGHTVTKGDRFVTAVADIVHVTGGAIWAGGVFMLATILWRRHRRGSEPRALQLALRFSVVATIALVAVGVAGVALAVIVLDSPSELWSTQWGRTLIAKALFVAAAAGAGGYNHKVLIPQLQHAPKDPVLAHRFRAIVTGEALALIAVVMATALLMGAAS
jgi:copper transport protein